MTNSITRPDIQTTCPYCGVGCGVTVKKCNTGVIVQGDPTHPANVGRLCSKGTQLGATLSDTPRLLTPQINGEGVSWSHATTYVAEKIAQSITQYGPDSVAFYLSGQILTEDYYVANKLMKGFIGSANVDTNSRLCMSSAVAAYKRAFGSDTVPLCYDDIEATELMVLVGSNAAWTHPVLFQRLQQAREQNSRYKVVVIDPKATVTARIADIHLAIKPGTDAMLFNGLLRYLYESDQADINFIQQHTEGFETALGHCPESINEVALFCAVPVEQLIRFYRLFAESKTAITFYSMGINQSNSGTDKCNAIINVHLASGKIGKPGSGPFSITGQPNAMGGREVGGLANMLAAHMDFSTQNVDRLKRFWQSDNVASAPGLKAIDMFNAIEKNKIKVLWVMGTNPAVSLPDSNRIKRLLEQCETVIVSDCIAKTDTTVFADVLLPATTWGERDGTVTNSERRISRQRPFKNAPGQAKHDWWIICEVAKKMGFGPAFDYAHAADIFIEHAALSGFENNGERDFDISALATLTPEDYNALMPIQWPVNAKSPKGSERMFEDRKFFTPNGRAKFITVTPTLPACTTDNIQPLLLNTGRSRDQWHTMTRTSQAPKLRNHRLLPSVEMNAADMLQYQVKQGDLIRLKNTHGQYLGIAKQSDRQQPGECFIDIHWTKQFTRKSVSNALIPAITDPVSGQPQLKQTPVFIEVLAVDRWQLVVTQDIVAQNVTSMKPVSNELYSLHLPLQNGFLRLTAFSENIPQQQNIPMVGDAIRLGFSARDTQRQVCIKEHRIAYLEQWSIDNRQDEIIRLIELFEQDQLSEADTLALVSQANYYSGDAVCSCFGIHSKVIEEYVRDNPNTTVAELEQTLRCGKNCGSCRPEVAEIWLKTIAELTAC